MMYLIWLSLAIDLATYTTQICLHGKTILLKYLKILLDTKYKLFDGIK